MTNRTNNQGNTRKDAAGQNNSSPSQQGRSQQDKQHAKSAGSATNQGNRDRSSNESQGKGRQNDQ
ncbi:MAG: hypothetical protein WDA70_03910 [Lysobacteraceae bacterium]